MRAAATSSGQASQQDALFTAPCWEWQDPLNTWMPFHQADHGKIESMYASADGRYMEAQDFSRNHGFNTLYRYDYNVMTQVPNEGSVAQHLALDRYADADDSEDEVEETVKKRVEERVEERAEEKVEERVEEKAVVDPTYSLERMLRVREIIFAPNTNGSSGAAEWQGPRWSTEVASKLFAAPAWQQPSSAGDGGSEARRNRASATTAVGGKRPAASGAGGGSSRSSKEVFLVSENSWVAQTRRLKGGDGDSETAVDEQFVRQMRLTLNKLTVEKFDHLSDTLIDQISHSTRPNRGIPVLMQLVCEKATTQHHFIDMYVNLCTKLHHHLTTNRDLAPCSPESQTNFKRILLNQCQASFEEYLEPPSGFEGLTGDSLYEAQVKYKTKMLGNIKLVGELIRHGMLSPKISLHVAAELSRDDPAVREERLETLAVFLETVGPSLDDPSWAAFAEFEAIFARVEQLASDRTVSSRTRFLLRDLLDLRRAQWRTQKLRALYNDVPTTLREVHDKALHAERTPPPSPAMTRVSSTSSTGCSPLVTFKASPTGRLNGARRQATPPPGPVLEELPPAVRTAASPKAAGQSSAPSSPGLAPQVTDESLINFHKEVVHIMRQLGRSLDVESAVRRLGACPLPKQCVNEEVVDLIARMVDEPRERRQDVLPLLPALFSAGVFSPPELLAGCVATFLEEALADLGNVDPPGLGDIALQEMFPLLGVAPRSLGLSPVLVGFFDELAEI